ncbi:hypothetical protein HNQ80_004313 [Anaerosolibacter carboniphilus]|uniref:Uncharacterized protein n=1 Tax=Anaerosolibacter carboniphilus TaxID=1417629 RepID=A0A841KXV1_9FIRM|nr:hypothetical protein [Anaerosolibacter carboniphilus]MBB6218173.1 hypothetical protein [Anaerosolibacter carboniphilus]
MPSQNKTQYVGLNQWQGNEYPMREDYNEDNRKTEAKIKENADSISALREDFDSEVVERPGPATIILTTWDKQVQSIMAKVASGLNFELNGNMVVNVTGNEGNCESLTNFETGISTIALDATIKVFGSNSVVATATGVSGTSFSARLKTGFAKIDPTKYYLVSMYGRVIDATDWKLMALRGSATTSMASATSATNTAFARQGVKLSPTDLVGETSIRPTIWGTSAGVGTRVACDGIMVNEITADEYNNMTVDQLLAKYPYINSAQPTLNPVVDIVQGKNLFDKNDYILASIDSVSGVISYANNRLATGFMPVKPNTSYCANGYGDRNIFYFYDKDKNFLSSITSTSAITPTNCRYMRFYATQANNVENIRNSLQLEEGTVATAYEPFRGTKTIAPCMLGKIGTYVDKLVYKDGVFKKIKRTEKLILDGGLGWEFSNDYTGFKRIRLTNPNNIITGIAGNIMAKYDGKILVESAEHTTKADIFQSSSGGYLYISVADTDTGWGESYTPTADEIKAFFMGWTMYDGSVGAQNVYNGTGTKAWAKLYTGVGTPSFVSARNITIVSGSGTTTMPTQPHDSYTPYTLYYALAQPVEEIINIPSICELPMLSEGVNTIAISSGLVYERANPVLNSGYYHINYAGLIPAQLKNKPKNILKVIRVKDGVMTDDTQNWIFLYVSSAYGGIVRCYIEQAAFEDTARVGNEYWVLYEVLPEEYNCQVSDGSGTHADNLRTALEGAQETVKNLQKQAVRQIGDTPQRFANHLSDTTAHANKADKVVPELLTLSTFASGFSGSINYDKNELGLVTLRLQVTKDSDFVAGAVHTIATLPIGYRPNVAHACSAVVRTTGGGLIKDAYGEIVIGNSGVLSFRGIPSGVFTNGRILFDNTIAYTARG